MERAVEQTEQSPALARWLAAVRLLAFGLLAGLGLAAALRQPLSPEAAGQAGSQDFELYRAIVARMRSGEGYYAAAGAELRRPRGPQGEPYPTTSVFNWRLPTLAWLLARLPESMADALYLAIAGAAVAAAFGALREEGSPGRAAAAALLLAAGFLWGAPGFAPDALLVHETWAGLLIALAVAARARGWLAAALAAGAAAAFIRELAAPFLLATAALATLERRWREASAWLIVIVCFLGFWIWHAQKVSSQLLPADRAQAASWLQFGGWPFVLKTAHLHPLLLPLLPTAPWVVALLLPAALLGSSAWRGRFGQHAAVATLAYAAAFCCIGQPFNYLWGLLYTPLWPLGLLAAPAAAAEAWRSWRGAAKPPRRA